MGDIVDTLQRRRIRAELDRTMVVEAAAGTGKTTELVNRIVSVIAEGLATVDRIVAVTFTEKAAGELKLRMRARLEERRQATAAEDPPRAFLERALARLEEARVGTIHGFCADLLRERSVEARVDPKFETMTEAASERLYAEAFQLWLQEQLQDPPEGIRRALRRRAFGDDADGPIGRLRSAGWSLKQWRDFPARWRREPFHRQAQVDSLVDEIRAFAALTRRCARPRSDNLYLDTAGIRRVSDEIAVAESVRERDYDGLEATLVELRRDGFGRQRKGSGKVYGDGVRRDEVLSARDALMAYLEEFTRVADADLAAVLQGELMESVRRYEQLKERTGRLDFEDLLIRTRDLVRDDAAVRAEFQRRFTHVFIDEFQDTDPLQAEILLLLASDDPHESDWRRTRATPGKLFLVADPKQSIYRFRRADVGIYLEVKEMLRRGGAVCLQLNTSFRAVPSIQRAVNAAFAPWMNGDAETLQADYVPLAPRREDPGAQPAVISLPVPEPYGGWGRVTKSAIERSLPDAVGAFVQWLVHDSGWTVTERENPSERVPVQARHVCLLFRRFDSFFAGDITRPYVQALEARGIRHLLVGGRSFHEREEVETLRTALSAVEWPDDELSVFATLHGSLFAVGDAELLEYRHHYRHLHPFRLPEEEVAPRLRPIVEALELLAALHRARNARPIAETINVLLEATRAHAGFVLRPSGHQALANVLHVAEQARGYERDGGISFRGFVERLLEEADNRRTAEAPILEEGADGVRVMTVHRAKGLEFPVVILADITADIARGQAGRHIDPGRSLCAVRIAGWSPVDLLDHQEEERARDVAEGVRLAYVAATRARDLLVVPAVADERWGNPPGNDTARPMSWVAPLHDALYPPRDRWSQSQPAPGCPPFGQDGVLTRPQEVLFNAPTVKPGRHDFEDAGYAVTWWDAHALDLRVQPLYGIPRAELLGKETDPAVVESDKSRYEAWERDRRTAVAMGSEPSLQVMTATARAASPAPTPPTSSGDSTPKRGGPVEVVDLPREASRPSGPRFGTLVHAVLATVALEAEAEQIERVSRMQGRILGADVAEVEACRAVAREVLAHPLLERARQAARRGGCRRETPVVLREPDGTLVDGVVDLAFRDDDGWTVVDFKTDRELEEPRLDVYRRQVALYAAAVGAATGQKTHAVLMRV